MESFRSRLSFIILITSVIVLALHLNDLYQLQKDSISSFKESEIEVPKEYQINEEQNKKVIKKPLKKTQFLNVHNISDASLRFSKEDYEGQKISDEKIKDILKNKLSLEQEAAQQLTLIEQSLKTASDQIKNMNHSALENTKNYRLPFNNTESFAFKLELPEENRGLKVKFQYREAPDFGRSNLPEPILPTTRTTESATFSIERSKTSESPWNNFSVPNY